MGLETTEIWLKSIFNINRELDFEREQLKTSYKRIEELEKQKEEIFNIISLIKNPVYKQILHKRYIQGKKWEEISEELHYDYTHVHRIHKQAVLEVHNIKTEQK